MKDFTTIEYLKNGNQKQIQAFGVLTKNNILAYLAEFDPILVGTIPIDIDIKNSDLDIICCWKNKTVFIEKVNFAFGKENEFTIKEIHIDAKESVVANFKTDGFEIEVFAQNTPTKNQNGYKHLITEYEILQSKDENFRLEIIRLKQNGYKTEPAFAFLLGLSGNPYFELLKYKV